MDTVQLEEVSANYLPHHTWRIAALDAVTARRRREDDVRAQVSMRDGRLLVSAGNVSDDETRMPAL
jgi:hypothetical protein